MSKHFLHVGSLLRPEKLLKYKREIEKRDDIKYPFYDDFPGYLETENEATAEIVQKQLAAGLPVITDGEYSKSMWHLDFVWGLHGVERYIAKSGYFFRDFDEETPYETRKDIGIRIVDRLNGKHHQFIKHFQRLQSLVPAGTVLKQCIPSASHIYGELSWSDNVGGDVYKDKESLKRDIIQSWKDFLKEYAEVGGTIIQFDDCLWEIFAKDNPNSPYTGQQADLETIKNAAQEFIDINNEVIAYAKSLGLKVWTHNCRGNYDSRNMGAGSYSEIADLFLAQQNYDRFFLEWDDERAGGLEALSVFEAKPETEVVLGLLSSKTSELDDEVRVKRMLQKATDYVAKDKLYLSHQCGFASCDGGNELTEAQEWAKIRQGQQIALDFWAE
jgi:methionine synthase II (cobalamin-independent)